MCGGDRGVVLGLHRSDPRRDLIEYALSLGVRGIDTAYNYRGYTSHRALAQVAGDLLGEFTLSTKVGYFPSDATGERSVHSLAPERLREAIERSLDDLRRTPDVVFLHNPEVTLKQLPADQACARLADACAMLSDAVTAGLCGSWGIATWDARPVAAAVKHCSSRLRPSILVRRAGLSVADPILTAGETLRRVLEVPAHGCWGMSPFGGSLADRGWDAVDLRAFLGPGQDYTTPQAAFRLAFELPSVVRVAVGTTDRRHLRDLVAATNATVDDAAVQHYRALIRQS